MGCSGGVDLLRWKKRRRRDLARGSSSSGNKTNLIRYVGSISRIDLDLLSQTGTSNANNGRHKIPT